MSWTWTYLGADGSTSGGPGVSFPTQAEAEAWLGETWADLLADGVEAVTLVEDGRAVYGPMGLRAAD